MLLAGAAAQLPALARQGAACARVVTPPKSMALLGASPSVRGARVAPATGWLRRYRAGPPPPAPGLCTRRVRHRCPARNASRPGRCVGAAGGGHHIERAERGACALGNVEEAAAAARTADGVVGVPNAAVGIDRADEAATVGRRESSVAC